jgi:glucose/arabinose dehydrogenase
MLALSSFASGLNLPLGFEAPNDGTNRNFIIEQGGTLRIIQNGALVPAAFLDISAKVESGGEEGLLGLAFHPSFSTNRKFYVDYTRRAGSQLQSVISEYLVSAGNSNQADATSERQLLVVNQPFSNHNGGQLAFGPDGFMYIAFGDGGSGGDPLGNGQNKNTMLGKLLRIGVDAPFAAGKQYAIPSDNPFASGGGLPEIWAYGLRNPWRFSFDRVTGQLFAGDVGQDNWEEVDLITKGGNFGWNIMEGMHCYPSSVTSCNMTGLMLPITEYDHSAAGGDAVIGGFVYRGSAVAGLPGTYVFGDLSSGHVWGLTKDAAGNWQRTLVLTHGLTVSAFGQDAAGELYLVDYGHGAILHMVAAP